MFRRPVLDLLLGRLREPRRFLQVLAGPRQTGKTTLARQALEVKSGRRPTSLPGLDAFAATFSPTRRLLVGGGGIPLAEFLAQPATYWTA